MRRTACLAFLAVLLVASATGAEGQRKTEATFGKDCEKLLLRELKKAREQILVAIYSFTRHSIRDALVDAAKRSVEVHVKYDAESATWPGMKNLIGYLSKRGVKCTDIKLPKDGKTSPKMHHKFVVVDGERVLTGSFNFSYTASTRSYENLVLIVDTEIAGQFLKEFDRIESRTK